MILATGNNQRQGFSLIELLVVIALIALAGGLVAYNAKPMLEGLGADPAERVFLKALREARFQAAFRKEMTSILFDREANALLIHGETGTPIDSYPLAEEDMRISFAQVLPARGLNRLGREETSPLERIFFRQDRSSTPFVVTFDSPKAAFSQRFDPFSDTILHDSRDD